VLAVGFLALGLRAALLPVEPIPEPGIHDEFSYLLMADTITGRISGANLQKCNSAHTP
jgi:hypothetical protein